MPLHTPEPGQPGDLTGNIYTDLAAIEDKLTERIDSLEKRTNEAFIALPDAVSRQLLKTMSKLTDGYYAAQLRLTEIIDGNAADTAERLQTIDDEIGMLNARLDSARERGTGGVQDSMKLITELQASLRRMEALASVRTRNFAKGFNEVDEQIAELRQQIETATAGPMPNKDPDSPTGYSTQFKKLGENAFSEARITYGSYPKTAERDASCLRQQAKKTAAPWDREMIEEIARRLQDLQKELDKR